MSTKLRENLELFDIDGQPQSNPLAAYTEAKGETVFILSFPDIDEQKMQAYKAGINPDPMNNDIDGKALEVTRRPTRGIEIKGETFASLSLVSANRQYTTGGGIYNSSAKAGDKVGVTANFMLISASETRSEKAQPVPTFGQDIIYFFGEQPRQMQFQAVLLNTHDFRWEEEWWANYEAFFRGTSLVSTNRMARLKFDETIVYGYLSQCATNKNAQTPYQVALSFSMYVTDVVSTRGSRVGSRAPDLTTDQYGFADGVDVVDAALNPITIGKESQAVRYQNLEYYAKNTAKEGGVVQKIFNTIDRIGQELSDFAGVYNDFVNYIYGRNLVIPVDFAYAEASAGNPTYAEGSSIRAELDATLSSISSEGADTFFFNEGRNAGGRLFRGNITVRTKTDDNTPFTRGDYFLNYDEYVGRAEAKSPGFPAPLAETDTPSALFTEDAKQRLLELGVKQEKIDQYYSSDTLGGVQIAGSLRQEMTFVERLIQDNAFSVWQLGAAAADRYMRVRAAEQGNIYADQTTLAAGALTPLFSDTSGGGPNAAEQAALVEEENSIQDALNLTEEST